MLNVEEGCNEFSGSEQERDEEAENEDGVDD